MTPRPLVSPIISRSLAPFLCLMWHVPLPPSPSLVLPPPFRPFRRAGYRTGQGDRTLAIRDETAGGYRYCKVMGRRVTPNSYQLVVPRPA